MLIGRLQRGALLAALVILIPACGVVDSIFPPAAPEAAFSADPLSGSTVAPVDVTFDAGQSTGNITGYRWLVNGSQVGTSEVLHHTFDVAGNYKVTLVVLAGDVEDT